MKTLHYRTHGITEGGFLTQEGLDRAKNEGAHVHLGSMTHGAGKFNLQYSRLFIGPLGVSSHTAISFCKGMGYIPSVGPAIEEIGSAAMISGIFTTHYADAVEAGHSNYGAYNSVHTSEERIVLGIIALKGVAKMFDSMKDEQTAIAIGHSPIIEIAAMGFSCPRGWDRLGPLDGLIFQEGGGKTRVTRVILAVRDDTVRSDRGQARKIGHPK